jgi:hypothetical protein
LCLWTSNATITKDYDQVDEVPETKKVVSKFNRNNTFGAVERTLGIEIKQITNSRHTHGNTQLC